MEHTERYDTSLQSLSRRFRETKRSCALQANTPEELAKWRESTRKKLRELTGIDRLQSCPLQPQLVGEEELPGESFRRLKYRIQTEEGVFMPFYLLAPKEGPEKKPVMICTHGHGSGGKLATGGRTDIEQVRAVFLEQHYEYGIEFARRGFMAFCPDARGFGERRELSRQGDTPEQFMGSCCKELNQMAIPLGLTVTGMWVFDLMRLVDYILSRPDCDPERIGVSGLSGGGQQSLWLAALDERVAASAVSGYFYGYHDALLILNDNCSCNYVPHLWETADMGDIGALIAPRPLVVETGDEDPLNGPRGPVNALEQAEITRRAYQLLGAEDNFLHRICHGRHRWYGGETYDFMCERLSRPGR